MGQAARWVETGEKSEMMSRLLEELRRTAVFQMLEFDVIDPIRETYPDQYREMTEVAAKVTDTLRKDLRCMRDKVWASPTLNNIILKIIDFSQVSRHSSAGALSVFTCHGPVPATCVAKGFHPSVCLY